MPLIAFDHVNIRTSNLDSMVDWYRDILGMQTGRRPDFSFPGAWLYLGEQALVHLVGVATEHQADDPLRLEHFAFRAKGLENFIGILAARNIDHTIDPVPGFPTVQVNLHDLDGNHIHVDFDLTEHRG
jgi:catechol 2,3-dioxygenase-like lactoylglutathione lyase family enzyme